MKFFNYRLYFGAGLSKQKPTTVTFKARSQKEADNKAHKFIREAELFGNFSVKKLIITILLLISPIIANRIDYQCLHDCLDMGYMYGYCKSVCS